MFFSFRKKHLAFSKAKKKQNTMPNPLGYRIYAYISKEFHYKYTNIFQEISTVNNIFFQPFIRA